MEMLTGAVLREVATTLGQRGISALLSTTRQSAVELVALRPMLERLYPCKIVVANDILEERSWIVELWDPASHSWLMTLPVPLAVTATAWSASDECAFLLGYTSDDEQPEDLCMAAQALRFNAYGTNKFQEVLPAPPVWRTRPAMALVDGNVYVCGGLLACGSATDAFESFSFPAGVWKSQAPLPSGPRKFATAVVAEKLLVLLCGQDEDSEVQAVDCWDTKAQLWRRLPAMDPGRVGAAVVLVGGRIMVCGGISDGCYLASVALLNLGQGLTEASGGVPVWQTLPSMHGPRADCAVAVSGGCVYVCGGEEGAGPALASVERLDCKRMVAWESLPAMAVVRAGAAAVVAAGHLLVFGGYSHEALAGHARRTTFRLCGVCLLAMMLRETRRRATGSTSSPPGRRPSSVHLCAILDP